ncbi:MAG: HD-GYP domain-containing protein [bacterium]
MIITELTPQVIGKKLGKNLYNASGNLLLRKGVEINSHYYEHFKQQGYQSIYLLNNADGEIESYAQLLPERFHSTCPTVLSRIFRNLLSDNKKKAVEGKDELIALAESILLNVNCHNKNAHCILDLKTPKHYLYQHSINVAAYSVLLAERLNYSQPKKLSLVLASLLHDIGMLFIDSNIVNKTTRLEKEEFEVVKEHTVVGFRHLVGHCSFDGLSSVASVQHHERYDGMGYPRKIEGEAIHEYSRIITLLDFFDAWTSDRPHRRLHSIEKAVEQIKNDEGAFDPAIVEAFLELFE